MKIEDQSQGVADLLRSVESCCLFPEFWRRVGEKLQPFWFRNYANDLTPRFIWSSGFTALPAIEISILEIFYRRLCLDNLAWLSQKTDNPSHLLTALPSFDATTSHDFFLFFYFILICTISCLFSLHFALRSNYRNIYHSNFFKKNLGHT